MPRVSVIVSTFDRLDALQVVLMGYEHSSYRDFEVLVADDGSRPETGEWVHRFARGASYPLRHVYQEKEGFRLAAVRNLAARHAQGEVLVLSDGDCVPYSDCLTHHALRCRPGMAQAGGRCNARETETRAALAAPSPTARQALLDAVRARETPRLRRLQIRNALYRLTRTKVRPKLQTANAAVHRYDFERVNGFDERFVGWGYEDEDLARRLRDSGVRVRDATTSSLVLHLFHPVHESHRPSARGSANYRYFKSGEYLSRPLRGLVRRDVRALSVQLLGAIPSALVPLRDPEPRFPEVTVVFGQSAGGASRARGEIVFHVDEREGEIAYAADLYRLLESRLSRFSSGE